ncbi:GNAT family N-acetyltransferase [Brevibacterium album]|uniref:GNAT family N-acetyltransferase n=1 Tax=Brevibacterium album TaxID=417948 RepID=UPI0003F5DEEF|nr:GNAT family N-acetyltransferase [Brevibacterium album]
MKLLPIPSEESAEATLLPFLAQVVNWSIDARPLGDEEILADETLSGYIRGWGRSGDMGVFAVDDDGAPLGAAWVRMPAEDWRGRGWAADTIPELLIAVAPDAQGEGVGTHLLRAVFDLLRLAGRGSVSLAVSEQNTAGEFFAANGFTIAGRNEDSDVLLRSL